MSPARAETTARPIYSVGHSLHGSDRFISLLHQHSIEVLADVRSVPHSRRAPQFDKGSLLASLNDAGITYTFLGTSLGGRPTGAEFYDSDGYVLYNRIAASIRFTKGVDLLATESGPRRVAMMCAEENPVDCHRRLLVARALENRGIPVLHIRASGDLETEDDLGGLGDRTLQTELFGEGKQLAWRSTRSVLPGKLRRDSLGP